MKLPLSEDSVTCNTVPKLLPFSSVQKPCLLNRMALPGLRKEMWTEEHLATMDQFLKDVTKPLLVFYIDDFAGLKVEFLMPHQVGTPWALQGHLHLGGETIEGRPGFPQ